MEFYRYTDHAYESGVEVSLNVYRLLRETCCGYWITPTWNIWDTERNKHWVPKASKKRYAYPTKEQALESFMARKRRLIDICKWKIDNAQTALEKAEDLLNEAQRRSIGAA